MPRHTPAAGGALPARKPPTRSRKRASPNEVWRRRRRGPGPATLADKTLHEATTTAPKANGKAASGQGPASAPSYPRSRQCRRTPSPSSRSRI
jgi:hypothetical protein